MRQSHTDQTPEIFSLTDLRYKTKRFLALLEKKHPIILVKKSKKIGVIYPVVAEEEYRPEHGLKIKPLKLDTPNTIDRDYIYNDESNR